VHRPALEGVTEDKVKVEASESDVKKVVDASGVQQAKKTDDTEDRQTGGSRHQTRHRQRKLRTQHGAHTKRQRKDNGRSPVPPPPPALPATRQHRSGRHQDVKSRDRRFSEARTMNEKWARLQQHQQQLNDDLRRSASVARQQQEGQADSHVAGR
jgi:hypothetical protein